MTENGTISLRMGPAEAFALVRDLFRNAGFDEASVCRAFAIAGMSELPSVNWDALVLDQISEPLRWCLAFFVRGAAVPLARCHEVCGATAFDALGSLGLLTPVASDPAMAASPVWVYPADGFVIASDRPDAPEGDADAAPADVVFPGIDAGTLKFLRLLPPAGGSDALDLCGGCGIGALHLARSGRAAVTADVTPRAAFFAAFNARLNGIDIESVCGDLFAPVAGREFDLISAHPPFVPASGRAMVFRDGGETGEDLIRRTVEGLPSHLRAGGTSLIRCAGHDLADRNFEQRAREWLAPHAEEFDLVFALEKTMSTEEVVASLRRRWGTDADDQAREMTARFAAFGTRQLVYGTLAARRGALPVMQPPARVRFTSRASWSDLDRLFAWRDHARKPGFAGWLEQSRPRLAPHLELAARHVVRAGALVPAEFVFRVENGIQAALRPDAFVAPLIAEFDGTRTVAGVFADARASNAVPQAFTIEPFLDLVRLMVELGLLELAPPIGK
jgi:hypothetical protein